MTNDQAAILALDAAARMIRRSSRLCSGQAAELVATAARWPEVVAAQIQAHGLETALDRADSFMSNPGNQPAGEVTT